MSSSPKTYASWMLAVCVAIASGCDGREENLELVGTSERSIVEVASASSEQILAIEVEPGEVVDAGKVLVRLDATFAAADEARAAAELAAARTVAATALHDHARMVELCETGVASDQQCEQAVLERDEAIARRDAAEANLAAAAKRRSDHTLVAPVASVVDQIPFDEGERVPAGGVVAVLVAREAPWVRVWIPERRAARLPPGTPARVRIDGLDRALHGHITEVAREPEFTPHYALTERERMHLVYEARIRLDDAPDSLRAGLPATVTFPTSDVER